MKHVPQNAPLISVVLPIHNAASSIGATLQRLINQTYSNLEIICVDDGSTDYTLAILEVFRKSDARVHIISTPNQGAYLARCVGLDKARGRFVYFCDADDTPNLQIIEKLVCAAISSGADIAVCAYTRNKNGIAVGTEMKRRGTRTISAQSGWLASVNTALWNKLISTSLAKQYTRQRNPPRIMEDALFLFSIYPHAKKMTFVEDALYEYETDDNSSMSKLTDEELVQLICCWKSIRDSCEMSNSTFVHVIDWAAFIHLGISAKVSLLNCKNGSKRNFEAIDNSLICDFPSFSSGSFSSFLYAIKNSSLPSWVALKCQKAGCLSFLLRAYLYLSTHLKIDKRW